MTEYVVLVVDTDAAPERRYRIADGKVEATSAQQAIRKVAERDGEGRYVATPLRSWEEHDVQVATVPKVTFGSGS